MDTILLSNVYNKTKFPINLGSGDNLDIIETHVKEPRDFTDYHLIIFDLRGSIPKHFELSSIDMLRALKNGTRLIIIASNEVTDLRFSNNFFINFKKRPARNKKITKNISGDIKKYLDLVKNFDGYLSNMSNLDSLKCNYVKFFDEATQRELNLYYNKNFSLYRADTTGIVDKFTRWIDFSPANYKRQTGMMYSYKAEKTSSYKTEVFAITELGKEVISCKINTADSQVFIFPALDPEIKNQFDLLYNIGKKSINIKRQSIPKVPSWIREEIKILNEEKLNENKNKLSNNLSEIENTLDSIENYKSSLYLKGDDLIDPIISIFNKMNIKTFRKEEHNEDFWILNNKDEKIIIVEVKGTKNNAKRKHYLSLEGHKDTNNLDDDFPSLLIIDSFCEAKSLEEKDKEISDDITKKCSNNNILVLRTLDLINLLNLHGKKDKKPDIIKLLTENNGWMKVTDEGFEFIKE